MKQQKQRHIRMTIYFPLDGELLEKVRTSAKVHRRSFNQEVLSMLEESVKKAAEHNHDTQII